MILFCVPLRAPKQIPGHNHFKIYMINTHAHKCTNFNIFWPHTLLYLFYQFIDTIRTSSLKKFKWVTYLCTQLYVCISLKLIKCTVDVLQNFIEILHLHVLVGLLSCSLFFKYFAGIYNQNIFIFPLLYTLFNYMW